MAENLIPTKLEYYEDMWKLQSTANLLSSFQSEDGRQVLILDSTIFHPQGGGQPSDTGLINNSGFKFVVQDVRSKDKIVYHYGIFENSEHGNLELELRKGAEVLLHVDEERRKLNSRLHSAGHLLDICMRNVGLGHLEPGKGYHFPDGPFVEYKGTAPQNELLSKQQQLELEVNNLIAKGGKVCVSILPYNEAAELCVFEGQRQQSKSSIGDGVRTGFKSEEYDITGANLESLVPSEGPTEAVLVEGFVQAKPWWEQFPKRWVIVLLCFASFLLCNMDRVNMSIAILPMSKEFNWNSATVGVIQSSFFWGYLLTQIIGGIWADKIGGKIVLGFGVVWWSVATVLTPIAARIGLPFLLMMRAFMGIGEGVAMPAMNNLLSKWIPVSERSRSLALVYSGMYLGSVTGLAFSPVLIHRFGWPSVFYSFGSLGIIWIALWLRKAYSSPGEDPHLSAEERKLILGGSAAKEPVTAIPWKLILSKPAVWALIISHFCHNWGTFILLTWMPTYYNQVLKFNLTESGLLCVLPWLTMAVFANIGGWIADTLVSKGLSLTSVRKIMQSIGFLGPAFFLTQLSHVKTPAMAVLCMACSQGSDAFSQSGLYSNHQDIGPRYAGVLLGLSNTAGVLAGVFGTAATGYILQRGSWDDVFKVSVALYILGTVVWNFFSTGEKVLE